jgi:biopolymer transport protein ExbD
MRHVARKRLHHTLAFNMAPMIDVVFLLIVFFVLVSTFASAEHVAMELPDPEHSEAKDLKLSDRVILNIQLADASQPETSEVLYSLGPNPPEALEVISDRLVARKSKVPDLKVVIRADRRVGYGDVRAVMEIVANARIRMMNIVARVGRSGEDG